MVSLETTYGILGVVHNMCNDLEKTPNFGDSVGLCFLKLVISRNRDCQSLRKAFGS